MAYENGISRLQETARDDLFWFTCKVMPAVQKTYKPIRVDETNQHYYDKVTPSDEAFGLFCFKYYKDYTSYVKGRGRKINKDINNNEAKTRKDKIGGKTLQKAIREYDDWHRKFMEIRNKKQCNLSNDIKVYCRQLENNNKEKKRLDEYGEDSLDVGMLSVPV